MEPGGLGVEMSCVGCLEYAHEGFVQSFSSGPSLDVSCSKETINSLSLTRRTMLFALCSMCKVGEQSWQEEKQEKEQKADFYGVLQFPYLNFTEGSQE